MTAVTVQSNKIVSNEVKDNLSTTRAILRKKNERTFWPTQYLCVLLPIPHCIYHSSFIPNLEVGRYQSSYTVLCLPYYADCSVSFAFLQILEPVW